MEAGIIIIRHRFTRNESLLSFYFTAKSAKTMLLQLCVLCVFCGAVFHKLYILTAMAAPPLQPLLPDATASMQITRVQAVRLSRRGGRASAGTTQRMYNDEAAGLMQRKQVAGARLSCSLLSSHPALTSLLMSRPHTCGVFHNQHASGVLRFAL
jgi:hypothetical protein